MPRNEPRPDALLVVNGECCNLSDQFALSLTCSSRIKCDETKPSCVNCTRSNRECEGYRQRIGFREGLNAKHRNADQEASFSSVPAAPAIVQLPTFSDEPIPIQIVHHQPPPPSKSRQRKKQPKTAVPSAVLVAHPEPTVEFKPIPLQQTFNTPVKVSTRQPPSTPHQFHNPTSSPQETLLERGVFNNGSPISSSSKDATPHTRTNSPSNFSQLPKRISTPHQNSESTSPGNIEEPISDNDRFVFHPLSDTPRHTTNYSLTGFSQLLNHVGAQNEQTKRELSNSSNIAVYAPSPIHSPLMVDDVFMLFSYFIHNFGSSMTLIHRVALDPYIFQEGTTDRRGMENFWTYDAPLMALNQPHVLNAILALASVQYSNSREGPIAHSPNFNGMTYYQNALTGLREDMKPHRFPNSLAALTTSLLLAFFETMHGDLPNWLTHMHGARDIIMSMDLGSLAAGAEKVYASGAPHFVAKLDVPAVQTCDILASYLHMELMQSAIGRIQLLLPVDFWEKVPLRHAEDPRMYAYDVLLRYTARLCSWVAKDTKRKEKLYGPSPYSPYTPRSSVSQIFTAPDFSSEDEKELTAARLEWENIRSCLEHYQIQFAFFLTPLPMRGPPVISPFGPHNNYSSSIEHFLVPFLNMAWLMLIRNNPNVPAHGYQTLRYTAQEGVPYMLNILRSLPPAVPHDMGHIGNENLDPGQTVRIVIDICVPIFFAAIQVREPSQQNWIYNWLESCYEFTGWSTCKKIQSGIRTAWKNQKAAIAVMSPDSGPPSAVSNSPASSMSINSSPSETASSPGIQSNSPAKYRSNSTPDADLKASVGDSLGEKTERVNKAHGLLT